MAITLMLSHQVTDKELLELAERNPGYQFERDARGSIVVTPTGSDAGRRELRLGAQLDRWADQHGGGVAFGPSAGFRFPDGWVRSPDASWVKRDRWTALSDAERRGFAPLCPDAVFEIRSAGQSSTELQEKMRAYLANGAQLAVLIDPYERIVEIYRPGREPESVRNPEALNLDPELPGFALDLRPIFSTD